MKLNKNKSNNVINTIRCRRLLVIYNADFAMDSVATFRQLLNAKANH